MSNRLSSEQHFQAQSCRRGRPRVGCHKAVPVSARSYDTSLSVSFQGTVFSALSSFLTMRKSREAAKLPSVQQMPLSYITMNRLSQNSIERSNVSQSIAFASNICGIIVQTFERARVCGWVGGVGGWVQLCYVPLWLWRNAVISSHLCEGSAPRDTVDRPAGFCCFHMSNSSPWSSVTVTPLDKPPYWICSVCGQSLLSSEFRQPWPCRRSMSLTLSPSSLNRQSLELKPYNYLNSAWTFQYMLKTTL